MIKSWFLAIRPRTLLVSVAPIMLGQSLAWLAVDHKAAVIGLASTAHYSWLIAGLVMACAVLLQVSVNLANDYFDHLSGVDAVGRLGPERAAQQGWLSLTALKRGFILTLTLGILIGLLLIALTSAQLFWLGLVCVLGVLGYTSGPFPLAYNALGEAAVFVVFGPIAVLGGYFAQHQQVSSILYWPAIQMGLLAAAVMLTNNIRDRQTDVLAGKKTVVAYLGEAAGKSLYCLMILLSVGCMLMLVRAEAVPVLWVYLLVPWALWLCFAMFKRTGKQLNGQLAQTTQFMVGSVLLLIVDVLFSI